MKKLAAIGLMVSAASWLLRRKQKASRAKKKPSILRGNPAAEARHLADQSAQRYLMYFIVPAWGLVGALDWLWHRQTKIETTSGPKESAMHLMMMAEAGLPVLAGLFPGTECGTSILYDCRNGGSSGNGDLGRQVHSFT